MKVKAETFVPRPHEPMKRLGEQVINLTQSLYVLWTPITISRGFASRKTKSHIQTLQPKHRYRQTMANKYVVHLIIKIRCIGCG